MKLTKWMHAAAAIAMATASVTAFDLSFLDDKVSYQEGTVHAAEEERAISTGASAASSTSSSASNPIDASTSSSTAASTAGSTAGSTEESSTQSTVAGGFLSPFSTEEPPETMFPRAALGEMAPIINVAKGLLNKPLPTNKWWGNIIHTTAEELNTKANPGWSNPYAVKLSKEAPYGIQACYSYNYRQLSALTEGVAEFYLHDFVNDITLSAKEFAGEAKPVYEVYSISDFGIRVRACLENKKQCLDSALVHGMAFVTATYDRLTASIESEYTMKIVDKTKAGKYILEIGGNQTWVVYTNKGATFALDESGKSLVSSELYNGTVRVAILPSSDATTVYDKYSTCLIRGGSISVESRTDYSLQWETLGKSCGTHGLLHFALPHHLPVLTDAITEDAPGAIVLNSTTRGKMVGQVTTTSSWTLSEDEDDLEVDFYPTHKPTAAVVAEVGISKTLKADIAGEWSLNTTSWYFNGKLYQKYASLCLMAADAAVVGEDKTLLKSCLTKLETLIEPFLNNTLAPPLNYETSYGGIVSSQSFIVKDVNADFGNSVYNDHHYHYGYWITASAMLKKLHPKWERMKELDDMIWMMLRDVANPSSEDKFFPKFRHFSFYLGHSYSHGVTPMADGKDEESTSEDVNFYYGMKLWGQVSGNKAVEDLGSLMLRLNARAIRTYFLMKSDNTIHPPEFVPNHVTGIFFDNKAAYATWFSAEKYAIHGIQMIPVSPINAMVRTTEFIQEEWDDILSKEAIVTEANTTNAWLSLLLVNEAAVDQEDALTKLQEATMDDGLTRSWALYNAASRKTVNAPKTGGALDSSVLSLSLPGMTISVKEAYTTLGLTRDASPDEVKKAYRKLALQFHPDKNPDPAATAKFQHLSAAYKRLDDHLKRGRNDGDQKFEDFVSAEFGDFDDDESDFDDDLYIPSMEEMLFMFDMLFGAPPPKPTPSYKSGGKRKKGKKAKKNAGPPGVRVNLGRKGGRQMPRESPGFPSYVDQELMDMFAHGMMFGDADDLEEDFLSMATAFAHSGMNFEEEIPMWGSDDDDKNVENNTINKDKQRQPGAALKSDKEVAWQMPPLGSKVCIHGKHAGVVTFTGDVHYAKGKFVGVALSSPAGKNDGSVKGVRYFECQPCHGLMVRPEDVTPLAA
ncbi:hypothetical protein JM16_007424 [Phytophthora kernoviae]|uniref:glucan endo-1,3-beta-D-glucosidase n=1 Tax=Phytophthora kernoviae TaxID=325452 RepID=A0A8T0LPY1_9STRA|nr:hypothetical protein JM16_007424 [Phytophthora kernoviae]